MLHKEKTMLIKEILTLAVSAVISAAGLYVFVFGNGFAAVGVDGIAGILQYLTSINAGYFKIALNLPLLLFGWFLVKHKYVVYTIAHIALSSLILILLEQIHFYQYILDGEKLLSAVLAGLAVGFGAGLSLRAGGSTGGTDIVTKIVQKKTINVKYEVIFFMINAGIVIAAYFVFGNELTAVLLSTVFIFVYSLMLGLLLNGTMQGMNIEKQKDIACTSEHAE